MPTIVALAISQVVPQINSLILTSSKLVIVPAALLSASEAPIPFLTRSPVVCAAPSTVPENVPPTRYVSFPVPPVAVEAPPAVSVPNNVNVAPMFACPH